MKGSASIDSKTNLDAIQTSYKEIFQWPKVELHAHLNGCIREETLFALAHERNVTLSSHLFSWAQSNTTVDNQQDVAHKIESSEDNNPQMYHVSPRSLQDCFDMFAEIPNAVNDLEALKRITLEALQDFADHHVVYLELRTTPKCLLVRHSNDTKDLPEKSDKRAYLQTVLQVIRDFEAQEEARYQREVEATASQHDNNVVVRLPMVCRLIVAVDRGQSFEEATENIALAIELAGSEHPDAPKSSIMDPDPMVVGVDMGGNPTKQDFALFRPLFEQVKATNRDKRQRLGITLHCAEVPCAETDNENDATMTEKQQEQQQCARQEAKDMLDFGPDRLGHALLLPEDLKKQLWELPIAVETCPTSNLLTLELAQHCHAKQTDPNEHHSYHEHHHLLVQALRQHHPTLTEWVTPRPGVKPESETEKDDLLQVHAGFPLAVCTDDPGVFGTNATQELVLLQHAFGLNTARLQSLVRQSLDHAFCNDAIKARILHRWNTWQQQQPQQSDESRRLTGA